MIGSIVEEVNTHRDNFQKVGMVMQVHEQHIMRSGVVTQEMAQYVNALIRDNEQKNARIEGLVKEYQVHADVLRQHHLGQQVMAEVIKEMIAGQQQGQRTPQPQGVSGTGPTVTEVDDQDPDHLDFLSGQDPHNGPPNSGTGQVTLKPPRTRQRKAITKRK